MLGRNVTGKYMYVRILFERKRFLFEQVHNKKILAKGDGLIIRHVPAKDHEGEGCHAPIIESASLGHMFLLVTILDESFIIRGEEKRTQIPEWIQELLIKHHVMFIHLSAI